MPRLRTSTVHTDDGPIRRVHPPKLNPVTRLEQHSKSGHQAFLVWRDFTGEQWMARVSVAALKRVLLSAGTQGHWTLITWGCCTHGDWNLGVCMLRNHKAGHLR